MAIRDLIRTTPARLAAAYGAFRAPDRYIPSEAGAGDELMIFSTRVPLDPYERYVLMDLYKRNTVYRDVKRVLLSSESPPDMGKIRALENPALQAVQFGVMHVFPGTLLEALPVQVGPGAPAGLAGAAEQVLQWSNMGAQKDSIVEDTYTYGDDFLKATPKDDNTEVFLDARHPGEVSAFREDNKRNMRYIRLDVPLDPKEWDGMTMWTEVWDREGAPGGRYLVWIHKQPRKAPLDDLGAKYDDRQITAFGHDFVPFVRLPLEAGTRPNTLCNGIFELHLEGIDQLNRNATDLDDLYKRNAEGAWLVMRNQAGLSAPEMVADEEDEDGDPEEHEAHGRKLVRMPGVASVSDLVASIDYQVGLNKLEDRRKALERALAELRFFRGIESGDPAAAAIAQDRAPAHQRAVAARGNLEDGVIRGIKMCISMGQRRGLFSADAGDFKAGTMNALGFKKRPVQAETVEEKQARNKARAETWQAYQAMGLLEWYLVNEEGFSETDAQSIAGKATTASQAARAAAAAAAFNV